MILVGDCVERMRELDAVSVDAIVCDPPYGLEFMGKDWDRLAAQPRGRTANQRVNEPTLEVADDTPQHRAAVRQPAYLLRCETCGGNSSGAWNRCACDAPAFRSRSDLAHGMQAWHERWAREALRVLKPGGYMIAAGGSRTYHRLVCAIEDAGFEIRDCITHLYGSGFPKSLNVAQAIDKAARGVPQGGSDPTSANHGRFKTQATEGSRGDGDVGRGYGAGPGQFMAEAGERGAREVVSEAQPWEGWGTALKPAAEFWTVARKPLSGTVAQTVLEHGTGALNVDGCRVGTSDNLDGGAYSDGAAERDDGWVTQRPGDENALRNGAAGTYEQPSGRWPANVVLSHSEGCVLVGEREVRSDGHFPSSRGASGYGSAADSNGGGLRGQDGLEERYTSGERVGVWACVPGCPVRMLDEQSGDRPGMPLQAHRRGDSPKGYGMGVAPDPDAQGYGDAGGASRFFYCSKASRAERNAGLPEGERSSHPTVKPIDLMRWLVRLVTPPGGLVLDPFAGSGTTGIAAVLEGFEFVGIERDPEYARIAEARIGWWREHPEGLPADVALVREGERRRVRESGQLGLLD